MPDLRFDDRLQTLLSAPVADARDRAVRWRQLVDLLSRSDFDPQSAVGSAALDLVRHDAFAVDEGVRGATLRGIAGRKMSLPLLRILAAQPLRVAAPLFAGMTLSVADAAEVLAEADDGVRGLVMIEPAPPPPEPQPASAPEVTITVDPGPETQRDPTPSLEPTVVPLPPVEHREPDPVAAHPPIRQPRRAPATGEGRMFEWESDSSGHIAWVEGAPRGALVGRPLGGEGIGLLERDAAARIGQRHPFVDVPLALGETLDGEWSATGVPAFDPASGRFLGYRGLARRTDGGAAREEASGAGDADALRELVHEIKTPLNAIIGFAEIIDGQYLGPAHANYRARAASIVGQARQLLEAVEDLDFAAKLRADRAGGNREGGRLETLFPPIAAELEACLVANGGVLEVDIDDQRQRCALSPELATRLLRRLLLSLCKLIGAGEVFRIAVTRRGAMCLLTIARPRALDGLAESVLVDPAFDPSGGDAAQSVGLGFGLRLVRGLAKVAGGGLAIDEHRITLELPALD